MVTPSVFTLDSRGNSAAPAAGSFAHGGKGTKTPFLVGHLWQFVPSGGQILSGCPLPFRATGPWRGKSSGQALQPGPPGLCHAVWLGSRRRAGEDTGPYPKYGSLSVGADTIRPPITNPLLRLLAPGALSWSSRTARSSLPGQRQRRGTEGNPLPCPRRMRGTVSREASPVMGSGGKPTWRTGRLAAGPIAASPGDSFVPF